MSRWLRFAFLALACAAVMSGAAAAQTGNAQTSVSPHKGIPKTRFGVSFKAPASTSSTVHYTVSASNAKGSGRCASQISVPVNSATSGSMVHVTLNPKHVGGKWCRGTFHGQVEEIVTTACTCGPPPHASPAAAHEAIICPAVKCPFKAAGALVSSHTIATFSFRVHKRRAAHHH